MDDPDPRVTTFVTLGPAAEPEPPPEPADVVVEYQEWHAADGDRPAVVGHPWTFVALAAAPEQLVATKPGKRTSLVRVDGPRYAFHARPVVSGATMWADSRGITTYDACGFRFAVEDPPADGWLSGVATMRYDSYQISDDAVYDACSQTLEVAKVTLVRWATVRIPGQAPIALRGPTIAVEAVESTHRLRLVHQTEDASFHVTVRLPR